MGVGVGRFLVAAGGSDRFPSAGRRERAHQRSLRAIEAELRTCDPSLVTMFEDWSQSFADEPTRRQRLTRGRRSSTWLLAMLTDLTGAALVIVGIALNARTLLEGALGLSGIGLIATVVAFCSLHPVRRGLRSRGSIRRVAPGR